MNKKLFWITAILLACFAKDGKAQTPDCSLPFTIPSGATVPFNVPPFNNQTAGCVIWVITYNSTGYSALSLLVQNAPNNGGVPGSWSTFTPVSGINPNTATTQNVSIFGGLTSYFPFVRVQLSSKTGTGTISGRLYGWRVPSSASTGGGGGGGTCPGGFDTQLQYNNAGNCGGDVHSSYNSATGTLTFDTGGSLVMLAHNAMGALGTVDGNGPTLYTTGHTPTAYASIDTLKQSIGNVGTTVQTSQSNWTIIAPVAAPANEAVRGEVNYVETSSANAINGQIVGSFSQVDHYGSGNMPNDSAAVNGYFYNRSTGLITRDFGLDGQSGNLAGGTITTSVGARGVSQNVAGGNITNGYGGYFYSENDGAGVLTNSVGVWIFPTPNLGTGTITNGYGIYIRAPENDSAVPVTRSVAWFNENQVQTGITAAFSWYSEGGTNHMETGGAAVVGMEIEAAAAQTANLFQCLASDGVTVNCAWGPDGRLLQHSIAFASLGTPGNGSSYYCTNCTVTSSIDNTATSGGTGCFVNRVNSAWKCGAI